MNTTDRQRIHRPRAEIATGAAAHRAKRTRALEAALWIGAALLAFGALRDAHAGMYKWTDEKGIVHYSDKMPADAVNRANDQLDSQGRMVRRTAAALTPEQIRARQAEAERQNQAVQQHEESDRRDRALLATYTRESEIDLARNRAVATIDGQVQSARVYVAQLTKRQQELLERKIAAGSKGAPPAAERELESTESELMKTGELIEAKKKEIAAVTARYEADKVRWRELAGITTGSGVVSAKLEALPASQVGGAPVSVLPTSSAR